MRLAGLMLCQTGLGGKDDETLFVVRNWDSSKEESSIRGDNFLRFLELGDQDRSEKTGHPNTVGCPADINSCSLSDRVIT